MIGEKFLEILETIVGPENVEIYLSRFGPIDDVFFDGVLNYEDLAFFVYTTSMNWHDFINSELWSGNPKNEIL